MKIAHFIASDGFGGAERVVTDLCIEMGKTYEVHLITFDRSLKEKIDKKNIKVHHIKKFSRYNIYEIWKFADHINRLNLDIIHTHGVKATKIIHTIRGRIKATHIATKHNIRKGKIFNKIPHVTAVSYEVAKTISNKNIEVIYNGISPINTKHECIKINKDKITLLAVGRLEEVKGFERIIKACQYLPSHVNLKIIGEGTLRKKLEKLITDLSLENKVRLLGFKEDIASYMSKADSVIMTSFNEGMPLVMIEALFYANMFLSTPVGGIKEVIPEKFHLNENSIEKKLLDFCLNIDDYQESFKILQREKQPLFLLSSCVKRYFSYYKKTLL